MMQDLFTWSQHNKAPFIPVVLRSIEITPGKISREMKHMFDVSHDNRVSVQ